MRFVLVAGALLALVPQSASAYSTRVHIMIANRLRDALIASGDGTIQLQLGTAAVQLDPDDVEAIIDHPLEFRAGAIGPDNMVFPGMTDPSHAVGQQPFRQCELLYAESATKAERAYALGCFVHGSSDAVAHHYVNFMSGETFTLTPLTSARQTGFSNVVRHIVAESEIQHAVDLADPQAFADTALEHQIPLDFVQRSYLDTDSALWQLASTHALAEYEATRAAMPDAALPDVLFAMDVAAADHLLLTPVYLQEVDALVAAQRTWVEQQIEGLQDLGTPDGSELGVTPGDDGLLGTGDDETDCAFTCPSLYATYFTYVGLLAPRADAMGNPLPSAFEKISDELRSDLLGFHPAYLQTVANLSTRLNAPLQPGESGLTITQAELEELVAPMRVWSDDIVAIDYDTLIHAVAPDWILELEGAFDAVGIDVDIAAIVREAVEPIVAPIEMAVRAAIIDVAQQYVGQLLAEYQAQVDGIDDEYQARLLAAAGPGLDGSALDHFFASGLFAHSFNLSASALANPAVVLPTDDAGVAGPASFDASHGPAWTQAGACAYLREQIFPLGIDARGSLSVRDDGGDHLAELDDDAPIECHDGSLTSFTDDPRVAVCALTDLATLLMTPIGSLSRAYPPEFAAMPVTCIGIEVPGLPGPPDDPGDTGGSSGGEDGGASSGGGSDGVADGTGSDGGGAASSDGSGCGCATGDGPSRRLGGLVLLTVVVVAARRRRRALPRAAAAALSVALGCGSDGGDAPADGTGSTSQGVGSTSDGADPSSTGATSVSADESTSAPGSGSGSSSDGAPADTVIDELDGTVWHGEQTRDGVTRAYELRFDADEGLWAEIRNPFGPARWREQRAVMSASGAEVETVVLSPQGWEPNPDNGRHDSWTLEIVDGAERTLRITRDDVVEEFAEGPWPTPTTGFTAVVRVFEVDGQVDNAFCGSGSSGFDYATLFAFANGDSDEIVDTDIAAGVGLPGWSDPTGNNQFSVRDVPGFGALGGTELTDTFNFVVTYYADVDHPGGTFSMRERDDSVEDGIWVFLADAVGSLDVGNAFLEVHGFAWPDETSDEPSVELAAGELPFQAISVRCTEAINDVDLEAAVGGGDWTSASLLVAQPIVTDELFPPAL